MGASELEVVNSSEALEAFKKELENNCWTCFKGEFEHKFGFVIKDGEKVETFYVYDRESENENKEVYLGLILDPAGIIEYEKSGEYKESLVKSVEVLKSIAGVK